MGDQTRKRPLHEGHQPRPMEKKGYQPKGPASQPGTPPSGGSTAGPPKAPPKAGK